MGVISEESNSFNTTLIFNMVELTALYFIFLIAFMICLFFYNRKAISRSNLSKRSILPLHSSNNLVLDPNNPNGSRDNNNSSLSNRDNDNNNIQLDFSESPNLGQNLHSIKTSNTLSTETTNFVSTQRNSIRISRNNSLFKSNALNPIDDNSNNSKPSPVNEAIALQNLNIRPPHSSV
ncbi:uncharacterized protein ASCRUDRAFT_75364 [Ascoidea rubescens DSM 1968]|uniref:Uncharacterized protein n=1 Tax=Ascoidea rubescens DSM 1968 TaxID=1344418 RepID=A0A1D2VI96_9ASCO|nr:hypothetical protein ASCRUDRAFT_75364 [Ascoidea rubescens DSM 1968]ODV61339.1 hypothetical protein ASCRUDRAFT_75364 [Ascoidea rubescens DSM 1968]